MDTIKTLIWESENPKLKLAWDASLVLLSSFVLALLGGLAIPLPFTPVPLATQPHAALLLGALLGPRRGAAAIVAFLLQGALGLPVFAGGAAGILKLIGPTGGYLAGYFVGAFLVGTILERVKERTNLKTFSALVVGNLAIYALGASYLSSFVGINKALLLGVAPFVVGDLLKIVASVKLIEWLQRRR